MDQRRAEPEISEVRDRRRPDRTSANPPWPQASNKQASKTRRGRGDVLPDRAAQHCAAQIESREGVKLEWARIYLGGQGDRPDEGIRMVGSREGTGTGNEQPASGRGANRGSDQPWKSETKFCRRSMLPFREANQLTCDGRVSRVVAVGAERSQFAVVVAFAAGVSPLVIDEDLRRVCP